MMTRYLLTAVFAFSLVSAVQAGRTPVEWQGDVRRIEENGQRKKGRDIHHHKRQIRPILYNQVSPTKAAEPFVALYDRLESTRSGAPSAAPMYRGPRFRFQSPSDGSSDSGFARWLRSLCGRR